MDIKKPSDEFLEKLATTRIYLLDWGYVRVGDDIASMAFELQQYRKAESADREMLKRLAVILSGSDAPGEIRALTVTAQSFVDRCKLLAQERDKNGK